VPYVKVEWIEGRTVEQRRRVIKGITDALVEHGDARREMVNVTFVDITKETWGRGGLLGIDREDVFPK
jgi:4-oxalocrotonate tautomerase